MGQDLDFENRKLCPDGACIGVIGKDGRCKVCGRADDGVSADTGAEYEEEEEEGADEEEGGEAEEAEGEADAIEAQAGGEESGPAFDEERELCPDGTCIGVIGENGRCKVCGAAGTSART